METTTLYKNLNYFTMQGYMAISTSWLHFLSCLKTWMLQKRLIWEWS